MYQLLCISIAATRVGLTQRTLDPTPGSAGCWLGSLGEDGHPSILICSIFTYSMFLTTVLTHQDVLGAKCKTLPSV